MYKIFINNAVAQFGGSGIGGIIPRCVNSGDLGCRVRDGQVSLGDITLIIIHLINLLTIVAGSLAVIMIMYSGFQLMLGELLDTKEQAKTSLQWAIIGLVVAVLAWVIVNLIQTQLTS